MSDIQFDEPEYSVPAQQIRRSLFADFLIKNGLAKDKKQAVYILLGVIIFCILVALWFLIGSNIFNGASPIHGMIPNGTSETVHG